MPSGDYFCTTSQLDDAQMTQNAQYFVNVMMVTYGWSFNACCGVLGNMQSESSINPCAWEGYSPTPDYNFGYGLVQWTPASKYTDWCTAQGAEITDMDKQCERINLEMNGQFGQYYPTDSYPISGTDYIHSNESPNYLGMAFLYNYERPADLNQPNRGTQAEHWATVLTPGGCIYTPRLDTSGMEGSRYWYSTTNPFYPENGLPNCTCYAWGRFWEISVQAEDEHIPTLPTGNAEDWWSAVTGYETGSEPQLGAVICLANGPYSGLGHVAIVEQIDDNGTVTFSNSAYNGAYFYLRSGNASNGYGYSEYDFQGFIYNPYSCGDAEPPEPPTPGASHTKAAFMTAIYKCPLFQEVYMKTIEQFRNDFQRLSENMDLTNPDISNLVTDLTNDYQEAVDNLMGFGSLSDDGSFLANPIPDDMTETVTELKLQNETLKLERDAARKAYSERFWNNIDTPVNNPQPKQNAYEDYFNK